MKTLNVPQIPREVTDLEKGTEGKSVVFICRKDRSVASNLVKISVLKACSSALQKTVWASKMGLSGTARPEECSPNAIFIMSPGDKVV